MKTGGKSDTNPDISLARRSPGRAPLTHPRQALEATLPAAERRETVPVPRPVDWHGKCFKLSRPIVAGYAGGDQSFRFPAFELFNREAQ